MRLSTCGSLSATTFFPSQLLRAESVRSRDQVLDNQVVLTFGVGVLKIGQRIDSDGEGNLPGLGGDFLDDSEGLTAEGVVVRRFYNDQDVVVLGVDGFHFVEGQ